MLRLPISHVCYIILEPRWAQVYGSDNLSSSSCSVPSPWILYSTVYYNPIKYSYIILHPLWGPSFEVPISPHPLPPYHPFGEYCICYSINIFRARVQVRIVIRVRVRFRFGFELLIIILSFHLITMLYILYIILQDCNLRQHIVNI